MIQENIVGKEFTQLFFCVDDEIQTYPCIVYLVQCQK